MGRNTILPFRPLLTQKIWSPAMSLRLKTGRAPANDGVLQTEVPVRLVLVRCISRLVVKAGIRAHAFKVQSHRRSLAAAL